MGACSLMMPPIPPLLVISDRSQAERPLVETAEAAFRAGCRWFSLREKDLSAAERRACGARRFSRNNGCGEAQRRFGCAIQSHSGERGAGR